MKLITVICDDDPVVLSLLQQYLGDNEDLELKVFNKPLELRSYIQKSRAHLAIIDIMMPNLDGIELLKEIKRQDPLCHVVMMTADSTLGRVAESLEHGAMDFLMKPFRNPDGVYEVIDSAVLRWKRWNRVLHDTAKLTYREDE